MVETYNLSLVSKFSWKRALEEAEKNDYVFGNTSLYRNIKKALEKSKSNVSLGAGVYLRHSCLTDSCKYLLPRLNVAIQRNIKKTTESP